MTAIVYEALVNKLFLVVFLGYKSEEMNERRRYLRSRGRTYPTKQ
jgi:hypothetical protein